MNALTRGALAKKTGMGIEAIRFYERKGLIPLPSRTPSGYRQYSKESVKRLGFIQRAKELGFSLQEIAELLNLRVDPKTTCGQVKKRAERKITEVSGKIKELQSIRRALNKLAKACRGKGPTSDCPILEDLDA